MIDIYTLINSINDIDGQFNDWKPVLDNYLTGNISIKLKEFSNLQIYPPKNYIFRAFNYFQPISTKVVIIGQDCYHRNGQAIGLSFGVNNKSKIPPSLKNIAKELYNDTGTILQDTSLESWAKQGVLLLNSALTVIESKPGKMLSVWSKYTDYIIKYISDNLDHIVFLLWGNFAINKIKLIDTSKHLCLKSVHPSPLSANRGGWFGNNHFTKANEYLQQHNRISINWCSL